MQRPAKVTLWIIGIVAALATAFYQIENWKGRAALAEVYAEIEADGETMTLYELSGDLPPPDDENFFKAPLVSSLIDYEVTYSKGKFGEIGSELTYAQAADRKRFLAMRLPDIIKKYGYFHPQTGVSGVDEKEMADFEAWAEVFRVVPEYAVYDAAEFGDSAFVLAAINSRFAREWEELNSAASRSHSFYRTEWGISFDERLFHPMPLYGDWLQMSKFLNLRISAAIEERDFQVFREAVQIYTQFAKGVENDLVLISGILRNSCHAMLLGTLWNGLNSKSFPENELQWIAGKLREFDSSAAVLNAYRGSRVQFTRPVFEKAKRSVTTGVYLLYPESFQATLPKHLVMTAMMIPDGWWDQNSATLQRFTHQEFVSRWKTMDFSGTKSIDSRVPKEDVPYSFIAQNASSGLVAVNERFMHTYVMNQLAILACEIEIYALRHGDYPDTLAELVPSQLTAISLDLFDGKPMKYRKVDDRYLVYSVGLNETDDFGKVLYRRPGRINKSSGDWVWDYRVVKKRDDSKRRIEFLDAIRKEIDPDYEAQAPKYEEQQREIEEQQKREISALQKRNLENAKRRIKAEKEKLRKK